MYIKKPLAAILVVAQILTLFSTAFSVSLFLKEKKELHALKQTIESLEKENQALDEQLSVAPVDSAAVRKKTEEQGTPSTQSDLSAVKSTTEHFLKAFYNCDIQRTGIEVMEAISSYLTPAAQKRMAPIGGGTEQGEGDSKYSYQSRITVENTYFRMIDDSSIITLSVCTLKVIASYGTTETPTLVRINYQKEPGTNKWKIDNVSVTQAADLPIDQVK